MNLSPLTNLTSLFSHWPTDWIIIGAVAVFIALDTLRSGGTRAGALALALPATLFALQSLSKAIVVGPFSQQLSTPVLKVVLFGIVFAALYVMAYRIIGFFSAASGGPIQALFCGIGATAMLAVVWVSLPELDALWHFGTQVHAVFGEAYRFWWVIGSYAAIAFARS